MNSIDVSSDSSNGPEQPEYPHIEQAVRRACDAALARLGRDNWEVSVLLCSDDTISGLNATYRKKEGPTDVLSFSQLESADGDSAPDDYTAGFSRPSVAAGDIVISVDRARAQAREAAVPLEEEIARLAVHGVLHLGGYDHTEEETEGEMFELQDEILASLRRENLS